jgi:hypothetical protein
VLPSTYNVSIVAESAARKIAVNTYRAGLFCPLMERYLLQSVESLGGGIAIRYQVPHLKNSGISVAGTRSQK